MPSVEVSAPVSSVASDRLALGVRCVSPGAGSVGGAVKFVVGRSLYAGGCYRFFYSFCFKIPEPIFLRQVIACVDRRFSRDSKRHFLARS